MIVSIGGSPEPLKKSLAEHLPGRVVFFASHDSAPMTGDILQSLDFKPKVEFELTENPNSLFESYKAARRCVDRAARSGVEPADTVVDYTGGTKVMTAALILATVGCAYRFNYVGGDSRSKNGLGIVENGHEVMYGEMNPWAAFAEEERRQVVLLFNRRRFSAVIEIIRMATQRDLPREIKEFFRFVLPLATGLLLWEQFNHEKALDSIGKVIGFLNDYGKENSDPQWDAFRASVEQCRERLGRIVAETDRLKRLHPILVDDLMNNARRRISDHRYDDAAARIYRALELYGQILFERAAGCSNGSATRDRIPSALREEFVHKYADAQTGLLKLPLQATFRCLEEMGEEAGRRFFSQIKAIKSIQSARNQSILAHGIQPVTEKAALTILDTVTDFVQVKEVFEFPLLP
jgi:CRISPR-associated protein (TIGR02710 family)